jgi:hypothetical protein
VRVALIVVAVLVVAESASAGPPPGLSSSGRALWNFEALLHDTFGNRQVCTRDDVNFVAGTCAPLSDWSPYFDVFPNARHSTFHLVAKRPRGHFGNYPISLRIRSRYIACDRANRTFLFLNRAAANFDLYCLAPL